MNERNEPQTYIEDTKVAEEVAYSAKDARSAAAVLRRLNTIVAEYKENRDGNPDAWPEASDRIMAAYAIYPEIFKELYGANPSLTGEDYRETDVRRAVNEVLISGNVPISKLPIKGSDGGETELDEHANATEEITEALLVHPPSQDFLNDYDLGTLRYLGSREKGYKRVVTQQDVFDLLEASEYYSTILRSVGDDVTRWSERINERRSSEGASVHIDSSLLRTALNALDRLDIYTTHARDKNIRAELREKARLAMNTESTTIADLLSLYFDGALTALESIRDAKARDLEVYTAIISGEAASYKSPDKAE